MFKIAGLAFVLGMLAAAGCGDNSRACGTGTVEEGGVCIPGSRCGFGTTEDPDTGQCIPDGSSVCSDGTVFDPETGSCKIDPAACQNGTVLVDDACVDPTAGLVIDVQEGPEPNGLGVLEPSEAQAGNITLKGPGGPAYVMHGTIAPWRDINSDGIVEPDVDTYVLTIAAPTFVRVTADGVGGAAAGFVAIARVDGDDALASWQRVGLSLVSDTSVRSVFLPRAGTYHLAIADTRTLVEYVTTGTATAAPGGALAEYYVSITEEPPPTPIAVPIANNAGTVMGSLAAGELAVYTAPLGNGLNTVRVAMPSALAQAAFVVVRGSDYIAGAEESSSAARALVGDLGAADTPWIVVEPQHTLLPTEIDFTLDVTISNAPALSTTGGTVSATATANVGTDFARLNLFAFDVAAADTTLGMQLAWSPAVVGEIYDATGQRAASFTAPSSGATWTGYRGLVRLPRAGRYYFAVYAPSASSSSLVSATSTITALAPEPITQSVPLTAPLSTTIRAAPFTYSAGDTPWQQFDVTGVNTGGQVASWFDPALAFGRLDALATSVGTLPSEVPPIFSRTFATTGGPVGRIVLGDGTADYYVKINAVSPTPSASTTLTFAPRAAMSDLGTITAGTVTRTAQAIDPTTPQRFYLFRTARGATVTIRVTPTSALNTQFRRLAADETPAAAIVNTSANGADVETFTVAANAAEWVAFVVSPAGNLSGSRTFDVSVSVQ